LRVAVVLAIIAQEFSMFEVIKSGLSSSRLQGSHLSKSMSASARTSFHKPGLGDTVVGYWWASSSRRPSTKLHNCWGCQHFHSKTQVWQQTCLLMISSNLGVKTISCGRIRNEMRSFCNSSRRLSVIGGSVEATVNAIMVRWYVSEAIL